MKQFILIAASILGLVSCKKETTNTSLTGTATPVPKPIYVKDEDLKGTWLRPSTMPVQGFEFRGINPATGIGLVLTNNSSVTGTYTLDTNTFSIDLPSVPSKGYVAAKYIADSCFIRNDSFFGKYRNSTRVSMLFYKP